MPAKSKAQQRFMGMVHALQKGEIKPSDVSDKVKKAADSMSDKDAEDFASTKHKGLPKKVKEALLRENPAAAAAAAMVMIQMQNPDTGNKVKAITPLRNKDHKLHGKAKGIFKRLKDKFSKKSESVEEGFGGDLKGSDKKKFEKARKENAEQLGYELTGTSDIKESLNEKFDQRKLDKHLLKAINYLKQARHFAKQKQPGAVWDRVGDAKFELDYHAKKYYESVNEGKKSKKAVYDIFGALKELIFYIKGLRKIIDDGPYNRLNSSLSGGLYKWEIDLEKKLRLFAPQLKKLAQDKMLESVNEGINDKMKNIMTKLAKSLSIKSVVDMYTGKGSLSYFLDDEKEALKLQKFLQKSFKRVRKINLDKSKGDTANFVVAADMLGLESVNEAGLEMNKLKDAIKIFQKKIKKQGRVTNARDEEHLKNLIKVYKQMGGKGVKESVNEVSGVDVAKKVLKNKQREKGIDLQTANLIVTIDKAYDKNPKLQKKFRAIQLPKMKQLIMKYYG